jgi:hypothetical protein
VYEDEPVSLTMANDATPWCCHSLLKKKATQSGVDQSSFDLFRGITQHGIRHVV